MQFGNVKKPPVGIVYDSNLGADIDSVLALALLHGFDGKAEAKSAAISINNPELKAAQFAESIESFYASRTAGVTSSLFPGLPIGLAATGMASGNSPIYQAFLAKASVSRIRKLNDTAIPELLIRNALTAQYDGNAAIVLAGDPVNLLKLLDVNGAKEIIASKAKFLVVSNATGDTKRLFAEWPTDIVVSGPEVGAALRYPAASIEKDYVYAPAHPVAEAYRAYKPMPYDATTSDMAAILYAVHPDKGYFTLTEAGGKVRRLVVAPEQSEGILKIFTTYASAKPVARSLRRPVVVDEEKTAAEKAEKTGKIPE